MGFNSAFKGLACYILGSVLGQIAVYWVIKKLYIYVVYLTTSTGHIYRTHSTASNVRLVIETTNEE